MFEDRFEAEKTRIKFKLDPRREGTGFLSSHKW